MLRWIKIFVVTFFLMNQVIPAVTMAQAANHGGEGLIAICTMDGIQYVKMSFDTDQDNNAPSNDFNYQCPLCVSLTNGHKDIALLNPMDQQVKKVFSYQQVIYFLGQSSGQLSN